MRRLVAALTVVGLGLGNPMGIAAQNAPQQNSQGQYTMTVNANIVLTNVVVRDKKTGELVKGLKASDFHIVEDKKAQTIASFDYQNVDQAAVLAEKTTATGKASIADLLENTLRPAPSSCTTIA